KGCGRSCDEVAMKARTYGPFPYSPIHRRPRLEWPGGARVALWVIPNIEFFPLSERMGAGGSGVKPPDAPAWAAREHGQREAGVREAQPHCRGIPRHDRPAIRRSLRRRRRVGPRHGDRPASVSERRAPPHRRARRGVRAYPAARRRVARDRGGDRTALYEPKGDALSVRPGEERSMTGRLAGKVAIVTGGGHGIGKAYALGLAGEGAKVVV